MAGILVHLSTKIFTVPYFTLLPSEDFMKFKLMPYPGPHKCRRPFCSFLFNHAMYSTLVHFVTHSLSFVASVSCRQEILRPKHRVRLWESLPGLRHWLAPLEKGWACGLWMISDHC